MAGLAPRLRQRRKAARPQELLEAALTLFVEKGLAATRTDDVARLAGVSKGTLYLYYPSKDALFKAVVHHYLVQVISEGTDLLDQFEGSAAELLRLLMQTWWTRVGAEKVAGLVPLIMAESAHFPELAQFYVDQVIDPSRRLLGRAIQRGIDRGEFRGVDVHMAVLALMVAVSTYSAVVIKPKIDHIRNTTPQTMASLPADHPIRKEFGMLHGPSNALMLVAFSGALFMLWADTKE